jgi:hypothetical protein
MWVAPPLAAAAQDDAGPAEGMFGPVWLETHKRCDLLGLGAIGTVPYNFPGADAEAVDGYRERFPGLVYEDTLPTGEYAQGPAILGGDLGAPFVHSDGRMYFTFGDAWFDGYGRTSACPDDQSCVGRVVADDLLARAVPATLTADSPCIGLEIPRNGGTGQAVPITFNGPFSKGGVDLGPGAVPGPGFSTGRYMFMLGGRAAPTCGNTGGDCAAANGIASDVCMLDDSGTRRCYFGECGDDPQSPCALRLNPGMLWVQTQGSDFEPARVGTHIASTHTLDAYRAHFSTASFYSKVDYASGEGEVWVVGRDSFWGAPGLTMSPYLMKHPVHEGVLQEPRFYAGMDHGEPVFSEDASDAVPLYDETALINQHTSLVYDPTIEGGTWLLMYGGRAQPNLRSVLASFVRPVVDAIFYDEDAGVYLRWAKQPWGPWADKIPVFKPFQRGEGGYCENMYFSAPDNSIRFQCPESAREQNMALNRSPSLGMAGEYGVAIVPGSSRIEGGHFTIQWLMSTWSPYRVIIQESSFAIGDRP